MRKMKDSGIEWIGEIPEAWTINRLKYVFDTHFGGSWGSVPEEDEIDTICVRVADFDYPKLKINFSEAMTIRSYNKSVVESLSIKNGDILLEKSGGGEITPVGRSVIFDNKEDMMCANFIECLRLNKEYDSRFINYWLYSSYINGYSKRNIKQTTGIQNLDIQSLLNELVVSLDVQVQIKIADYLDKKCFGIDSIINAKETTNEKLKEYRQSIIYEAVTKGLDKNVPMKDSGIEWIGRLPIDWKQIKIKYTGSYKSGNGITSILINDEDGFPVYGGNGLRGYTNQKTHSGEFVLIGRQGALCGNVQYVNGEFWASEHAIVGNINKEFSVMFLHFCLSSMNLNQYSESAAQPGLSVDRIVNLSIPWPKSLNQQKQITDYLDKKCAEIDSVILANEKTIKKLKEYRQSVIYEAVTGKKEIV